jgi:WD40 repeat protein
VLDGTGQLASWAAPGNPEATIDLGRDPIIAPYPGGSKENGRVMTFDSAISPDGSRVVTGNYLGVLRLWNAKGGPFLDEVQGSNDRIRALAFNPAVPSQVGTVDFAGRVNLWDISNDVLSGPIASFTPPPSMTPSANIIPLRSLAFDATGDRLVAGGCNTELAGSIGPDCALGQAYVLDVRNGLRLIESFPTKSGYLVSVAIDPTNPDRYALGHVDKYLAVYDRRGNDYANPKLDRLDAEITALSYSADGSLLAAGTVTGNVYLFHADSMARYGDHFLDASKEISSISFTNDRNSLVVGALDGTVVTRDLRPESWRARVCDLAHPVTGDGQLNSFLGDVTTSNCPAQ